MRLDDPLASEPLYYFVHLPKCAGTSLLKSVSRVGKKKYIILAESPESKAKALDDLHRELARRHQHLDDLKIVLGHDVFYGIHKKSQRQPAYFTFLRDPVARFVSHYRYLVDCAKNSRSPIYAFAKDKMAPDGRILSIKETVDRRYFHNVMTNHLAAANDPDISSKRWQIHDPDRLFALATQFLAKMQFIGFVESMPRDLGIVCKKLGLKENLRTVNRSKADVRSELDEEVLSDIKQLSDLDVALYERAVELRRKIDAIDAADTKAESPGH